MVLRRLLLFVFILSFTGVRSPTDPLSAHAAITTTTRYVAINGEDNGDCSSPSSPCRTIQYAVNQSASGDRILVAQGTYTYTAAADPCSFLQTRAVVCFVDKRLTILGGYSITNWSVSDPAVNLTIIDGQGAYRGVAAIGYNTTTAYLEMAGFTIRNCIARGPTYLKPYDPSGVGGGMLVQHASVTLRDMAFRGNQAIGADTSSGAGGQADGAALRIEEPPSGTTSLLQRVIFENNNSLGGSGPDRGGIAFGALFIYRTALVIEDAIFTKNVAQAGNSLGNGESGNLRADALGGGIAIEEGNLVLRRVTVEGNQVKGGNATQYGGGAFGGGVFVEDFDSNNSITSVTIADSSITGNTAIAGSGKQGGSAAGGGIDVDTSNIVIERTKIVSNSAIGGNSSNGETPGPGAGGGIYVFAIRKGLFLATFRNIIVAGNLANPGAGNASPGNGGGGGIVIHGVNADISHTTIAQNRISSSLVLGQALLIQPWPSPSSPQFLGSANLSHSAIVDHTEGKPGAAAIVVQKGSTVNFNQGIFSRNSKDTNINGSPVPVGVITGLSTMRSETSVGFVSPGEPNYNYHLRLDSNARDSAVGDSITDDIDQQERPYGVKSDFGADEYHPFLLTVTSGDGILFLNWSAGAEILRGSVGHYELLVVCDTGANPPNQGNCGQPFSVGTVSTFTLTGLTNFKQYVVEVRAYDAENKLIATSIQVQRFPTTIFIFLPAIQK